MIELSAREISEAVSAVWTVGNVEGVSISGVSIDSRDVSAKNLFVAIKGETHDGHSFIGDVIRKGVKAIIVDKDYRSAAEYDDCVLIVVRDTLKALQDLAASWYSRFSVRSVAVTGTNGKTTTKEMIADVLSTKYRTFRTLGNFNNQYGVPLSIFKMGGSYEVAVFEFGMSTPGEIRTLTRIIQPEYGLITNIDAAHLETMLSIDAIANAKFELFDNMPADGTAIMNLDNAYLRKRFDTETLRKVGFGIKDSSGYSLKQYSFNGTGRARFEVEGSGEIHLPVPGIHNLYNALAAATVGHLFDIPPASMKSALEAFKPVDMRMETSIISGVTLINDAYNANPASMQYALDTLSGISSTGKKYAVFGDMFELGTNQEEYHRRVGGYAAKQPPDYLVTSGHLAKHIADGASEGGFPSERLRHFPEVSDLIAHLLDCLRPGDTVLIKASRGMQFDRIATALKSLIGRNN